VTQRASLIGLSSRLAIRGAALAALLAALPLDSSPAYLPEQSDWEECTIAVISGSATPDGRPIIWKNRDTGLVNNEVGYFADGPYRHVTIINAGETTTAWLGVNDQGFAILNALSYNLPDSLSIGITNGELMKHALRHCATVAEFEDYLEQTNAIGRPNPSNFAVMDADGEAAIFEAGNYSFVRFDATDPVDAPRGFLTRITYSLSADTAGMDTFRYHRSRRMVERALARRSLDVPYLLQKVARDLCSKEVDPYPLPYEGSPPGNPSAVGFVDATNTINRRLTASAGAIQGVLPGEEPLLSTFYAIVGQPIVTIPLPVWVAAGTTPPELDGPSTSPLCDLALQRKAEVYNYPWNGSYLNTYLIRGADGTGWLPLLEKIEERIYSESAIHISDWRAHGVDPGEMSAAQARIASEAFRDYSGDSGGPDFRVSLAAHPNPMREGATIRFDIPSPVPGGLRVDVYDVGGRRVARLEFDEASILRSGTTLWDGRDLAGNRVPSGIYFLRPDPQRRSRPSSIVVIR